MSETGEEIQPLEQKQMLTKELKCYLDKATMDDSGEVFEGIETTDLPSLADISCCDMSEYSDSSSTVMSAPVMFTNSDNCDPPNEVNITNQRPQLSVKPSERKLIEHSNPDAITANGEEEEDVLMNALSIFTSLLSCQFTCKEEHSCSQYLCDANDNKEQETILNSHNRNMQPSIVLDFIHLMGCPVDGAGINITDINPPPVTPSEPLRYRNRNTHCRHQAAMRMKYLRKSGLSRSFSRARATSIDEDASENSEQANLSKPSIVLRSISEPVKDQNGSKVTKETSVSWFLDDDSQSVHPLVTAYSDTLLPPQELYRKILHTEKTSFEPILRSLACGSMLMMSSQFNQQYVTDTAITDTDLYYDSDPGCSRFDNPIAHKKAKDSPKNKSVYDSSSSILRKNKLEELDLLNPEFSINFVQELLNTNYSFIWHPQQNQGLVSTSNPHPIRIQGWFEMGSCLKKLLVNPKFSWRPCRENIHRSGGSSMHKMDFKDLNNFELLNVIRVLSPTTLDRKIYPFVKLSNAFQIITNPREEYIFEAATTEERDMFVLGLKLLVARLASKILVGDKEIFTEFFTPWGALKKALKKDRRKSRRSLKKLKSTSEIDDESTNLPENDNVELRIEPKRQNTRSHVGNFLVQAVTEEGNRTDELWGC
jgi:hypothetical protein